MSIFILGLLLGLLGGLTVAVIFLHVLWHRLARVLGKTRADELLGDVRWAWVGYGLIALGVTAAVWSG